MKLSYAQLAPHLARTLASVYVVSGDELVLKNEALNLLRKAAKQAGFQERIRLSAETDLDELYTTLHSSSLLAEKRLIEWDLRETTLPKGADTILQDYGKQPCPDSILILDMDKVDAKIAKTRWYSSLEKAGVVVTIWPLSREQVPAWIKERAKKYKLSLQPEAVQRLADEVEGNLAAAAQALEKLYLLNVTTPIDGALIQTLLNDDRHFSVFDWVENVIAGKVARALSILENLKNEGTEPTMILWGITRELRLLAECAKQMQQGVALETLFQQHRIFSTRQPAMRQFLKRHQEQACWQWLLQAAELDRIIKGAVPGNIWEGLELFCLRLA